MNRREILRAANSTAFGSIFICQTTGAPIEPDWDLIVVDQCWNEYMESLRTLWVDLIVRSGLTLKVNDVVYRTSGDGGRYAEVWVSQRLVVRRTEHDFSSGTHEYRLSRVKSGYAFTLKRLKEDTEGYITLLQRLGGMY